jgi:hypothetical protein
MNQPQFQTKKRVNEKVPCTLDLTNYLPEDETIQNTSTVTATDSDGADVSEDLIYATSIVGFLITAIFKAGTTEGEEIIAGAGEYLVLYTIITQNYSFEIVVKLTVE